MIPLTPPPPYTAVTVCPILIYFYFQDATGRLGVAKEEAGNNMIKYHQTVFPICIEIQLAVISQFGFRPDGEVTNICGLDLFLFLRMR